MTSPALQQFTLTPERIQFFDMGVEVGSDAHKLCQKFVNWKPVPDCKDTFWCGFANNQFTIVRRNGVFVEIAHYPFDSIAEFKANRKTGWAANACYYELGKEGVPSWHGHALLYILKKLGVEL